MTQCCEKPKQKPKAKHIKMPTFEREGVKERRKGRTELVNGGKKKGRKWMNERVKEWVMNEYNILAVYQTPWASKERLKSNHCYKNYRVIDQSSSPT